MGNIALGDRYDALSRGTIDWEREEDRIREAALGLASYVNQPWYIMGIPVTNFNKRKQKLKLLLK